MKKIVITGGVGSGKSKVINFLNDNCNCKVVRADDVAKKLMSPGQICYDLIINAFPKADLLIDRKDVKSNTKGCNKKLPFDKKKLSAFIFSNKLSREKINSIVHPYVKRYILDDIQAVEGEYDYYFLETALAIEEGYDKLFDETWYIYSSEEIRQDRLIRDRGYSEDRIKEIFSSQQSEEEFRLNATVVIDNNGDEQNLFRNIVKYL